jgi:molecular chaperone GrpE
MAEKDILKPDEPSADDEPTEAALPTAEAASLEAVQEELAAAKRERDDYHDRLLRKAAEFDNYRKRMDRERRDQAEYAVNELLLELLLVVDDFDRALAVESGKGSAAYRKGVELIHTKLHELLRKHNVQPIEALGTDFDPNRHQAVTYEASAEHREGEVIGELRRGYMKGERLLRPALVKVAKSE